MVQAVGARAQVAYCEESAWGTTPGTPTMRLLKAAVPGVSLGMEIEEVLSRAINANRAVEMVRGGNKTVRGSIPFELSALGLGRLLKHALGTVVTTGTATYTHTIKRAALPAGLTIEAGFNDVAQYFRFSGCKVDKFSLNVQPSGIALGSMDIIGKDLAAAGSSLGTATSTTHTPWMEHEASVEEGGSGVTVLGFSLDIMNALDPVQAVGSRTIASLQEGEGEAMGEFSLLFENLTTFNKWLNETSSSVKITFSSSPNSLEFYLPNVRYLGDPVPKISTDRGIVVPFRFRAIYDSSEDTDVRVRVVNTAEASF